MRIANRVDVSDVGYRFFREPSGSRGGSVGGKRGSISGFSAASVRRLRDYLLFLRLKTVERTRLGFTLTVPWRDLSGSVLEDYKSSFNRFGVLFRRILPNSAFVYRHELQRRRAPHLHGVLFLSAYDTAYDSGLVLELWRRALRPVDRPQSLASFVRYGVKGSDISDGFAAFRYLCDHASKHKQDQLGFKGRQWGVLGDANVLRESESFHFASRRQCIEFYRLLRRSSRFTVYTRQRRARGSDGLFSGAALPLDCPFGSKKNRLKKCVCAVFSRPSVLDAFLEFVSRPASVYPIRPLPR